VANDISHRLVLYVPQERGARLGRFRTGLTGLRRCGACARTCGSRSGGLRIRRQMTVRPLKYRLEEFLSNTPASPGPPRTEFEPVFVSGWAQELVTGERNALSLKVSAA
jgi:hypothetical protein